MDIWRPKGLSTSGQARRRSIRWSRTYLILVDVSGPGRVALKEMCLGNVLGEAAFPRHGSTGRLEGPT